MVEIKCRAKAAMNNEWSRGTESPSSFAKCDRHDGDLFYSLTKSSLGGQENGGIANIVLTSDGRDFRWRGGGMRREDEQRQDRKRRNDIDVAAGAPARGPPTRLPRCPRRVTTRGIRDNDTLVVRGAVIGNSRRGRSCERPIGWPRPQSSKWPLTHGE